jgi:hypothetical protein
MDWQKIIEQAIALFFPLIVVFVFIYYMLKAFFDQFEKQRKQEMAQRTSKTLLPLKFQAYERITLFLERIKPESMVIRVAQPGMTTFELQRALTESVREEYEHNLSQQIYVSSQAWAMVVGARQSMMQLITSTAAKYGADDLYVEYATELLNEFASAGNDPVTLALTYIQKEAKELM